MTIFSRITPSRSERVFYDSQKKKTTKFYIITINWRNCRRSWIKRSRMRSSGNQSGRTSKILLRRRLCFSAVSKSQLTIFTRFYFTPLNPCNCNTFFQLVCKHSRGSSGNPTDNTVVQLERIQTFIQDLTQITNEIRRQEAEQREKEKAKNRE